MKTKKTGKNAGIVTSLLDMTTRVTFAKYVTRFSDVRAVLILRVFYACRQNAPVHIMKLLHISDSPQETWICLTLCLLPFLLHGSLVLSSYPPPDLTCPLKTVWMELTLCKRAEIINDTLLKSFLKKCSGFSV